MFQDTLRNLKDQGFLSSLFSLVVSYPSSATLVDIKVSICTIYNMSGRSVSVYTDTSALHEFISVYTDTERVEIL